MEELQLSKLVTLLMITRKQKAALNILPRPPCFSKKIKHDFFASDVQIGSLNLDTLNTLIRRGRFQQKESKYSLEIVTHAGQLVHTRIRMVMFNRSRKYL